MDSLLDKPDHWPGECASCGAAVPGSERLCGACAEAAEVPL